VRSGHFCDGDLLLRLHGSVLPAHVAYLQSLPALQRVLRVPEKRHLTPKVVGVGVHQEERVRESQTVEGAG